MNKLKEALIKFTHSNPSLFPNNDSSYSSLIEQHFSTIFNDFDTTPPNHPPYAAMIHKAIWELNEKGGSSEYSISSYIKEEYVDLPWAHSSLLKHHLEKLCVGKEICMTHKQRYRLAGAADSDPISTPESDSPLKRKQNSEPVEKSRKKHKKLKSGRDSDLGKTSSRHRKKHKKNKNCLDSESGKTSGRHHKKHKKKKKCLMDIHKTSKQIVDVFQEQGQVVQPLDEMADEHENIMGDGSHEQQISRIEDQTYEQEKCLIDEGGINKGGKKRRGRKRKLRYTSINNSRKRSKKHEETQLQVLNEANVKQHNEVTDTESHEKNHIIEVNTSDIHKNETPGRRWTRSQQKTRIQKYEMANSNGKLDVVEYVPEEKQYSMEIFEVEQTPSPLSTAKMNGQRAKLRSSQKNTDLDEPTLTEAQDASSFKQDQQPDELEDQPKEDKPNLKRRGRPRKHRKPEKTEGLYEIASSQKNKDIEEPTLTEALDASSSQQDQKPDELASEEKQQSMNIIEVEQTPSPLSTTEMNITDPDEPTLTEAHDTSSQQDQQLDEMEDQPKQDKPKHKRRGRPRKPREPEKNEVLYEAASSQKNTDFEEPTSTEALDASSSQQDQKPDELASEEKQQSMEIIKAEQTLSPLSTSEMNGQQVKLRSSQNTDLDEPTLTEAQDASSSQQDQHPDELASEGKQQSMEIFEAEQTPSPLSTTEMNGQRAKLRSSQNTDLDEPNLTEVQDASSYQQDQQPDELASEEKQQLMEIFEVEQTPSPISSTKINGQRVKLRSLQKNTNLEEPTSTEARDPSSSQKDQQPDELDDQPKEDKSKDKGCGRPRKPREPEKNEDKSNELDDQPDELDDQPKEDKSKDKGCGRPRKPREPEKNEVLSETASSQKNTDIEEPTSTETLDPSSSQQDQQDQPEEDKLKRKGPGRPRKPREPETNEVLSETRSTAITKQSKKCKFEIRQVDEVSRKSKSTKKKSRLNYELHKMTTRSSERKLRDQSR